MEGVLPLLRVHLSPRDFSDLQAQRLSESSSNVQSSDPANAEIEQRGKIHTFSDDSQGGRKRIWLSRFEKYTLIGLIFARLNFAISRIFAIFAKLKLAKTCEIAKLNPREIFKIAFWVEKPVKTLHLCPKIAIFSCFHALGTRGRVFKENILTSGDRV